MAPGPVAQVVDVPNHAGADRYSPHGVDSSGSFVNEQGNILRLRSACPGDVHDIVCVGFGPASLAIAIALHDKLCAEENSENVGLSPPPTVRFLERQKSFKWHAGMLLPGAKMQISFIKDLATLRDPCSHFTYLNYLKKHDRLVQFVNLGTFLPSRMEFEDYLQWAAAHFDNVVDYGCEVQRVRPWKAGPGGKFDCLEVEFRNLCTGQPSSVLARNVVIAVGGRPAWPTVFPSFHERILHSSEYSTRIAQVLPVKEKSYNIAVVGGGQSAAEVFNDLQTRYPHANTRLIFRDTALRPSDDSPFVNELFNPEAVDAFYDQPEELRHQSLQKNKSTNYSVVRLELLERIYESQYFQSIKQPDKSLWQHQILPSREIVAVADMRENKRLNLTLKSLDPSRKKAKEVLNVDAVILATGYRRDAHVDMLTDCQIINGSGGQQWRADRDYRLKLDPSFVEDGVGIWLQGCNEHTHGLSDSLLSVLATRSGELVESIFGPDGRPTRP